MIIPCYNPCRVCTPFVGGASSPADPDYPFVNLSSEDPDVDRFFGRRYNPPYWPPVGDIFFSIGCLGFCASGVSQADADLCAELQAMECLSVEWPQPNPNGPPPTTNRTLFYNTQQSCEFQCPDGTPFNFIVAAGVIASFSQEAADIAAYSYACDQAVKQRICLMALTPSLTCSESGYIGAIVASTSNPPLTMTIEGDLPEGLFLSANETTLFITGVPTVPGDYTFSAHAVDRFGNAMTKPCSLTIFGIVNSSPLPNAEVDTPYSVSLFTAGTVTGPVTYSVTVGSLPDGLTLNGSTGEISGTPTTEGPVSFTVRATSASIACSKGFGIQVDSACGDPDTVHYIGQAGLFATGYDVTVQETDMFNLSPNTGFNVALVPDGEPKIAVLTVHWGEAQLAPWTMDCAVQNTLGSAFSSGTTGSVAFDTDIDKVIRIPVFPDGTNDEHIMAAVPPATMGEAVVNLQYDYADLGDFSSVAWGAVNISGIGTFVGSGTCVASQFNFKSDSGAGGDAGDVSVSGNFICNGNGVSGRLILVFSECVIANANNPRLTVTVTSNIDGVVWGSDTNAGWFTGNGIYTLPFVVACTPGSVLTVDIVLIAGGGVVAVARCIGTFAQW